MIFTHAGSLAFTSVLSLIPLIALIFYVLNSFQFLSNIEKDLTDFVSANLAPSFGDQIVVQIGQIRSSLGSSRLGSFGLLGFFITAASMFWQLEETLNRIWGFERARSWSRRITNYWSMSTLGPLMLVVSFLLTSQFIGPYISQPLAIVSPVAPILVSTCLISFFYIVLPAQKVAKTPAFISALVVAGMIELAKMGYGTYTSLQLKTSIYGSLTVLPLFFVWLYLLWVFFLIGAEMHYFLTKIGPWKDVESAEE